MEWIIEGFTLIFISVLVITVTSIDPASIVSKAAYQLATLGLFLLAIISLFTGFKVKLLPFKLCPLIFTISALLIWMGSLL